MFGGIGGATAMAVGTKVGAAAGTGLDSEGSGGATTAAAGKEANTSFEKGPADRL